MSGELFPHLLRVGWKLPYVRMLSSRRVVILLYHGISKYEDPNSISAAVFEQHICFLREYFEIVHPGRLSERRRASQRIRVLLTFDDGFRNHAEALTPVLVKHHVPALFFVSSRHSMTGKYLWFSYLRALNRHFPSDRLNFRGKCFDMTPVHRNATVTHLRNLLLSLRPHPSAMYDAIQKELPPLEEFVSPAALADFYAGMTAKQVAALAAIPFFFIGAHTVNHPFLSKCDPDESFREIRDNKLWIEEVTRRPCDVIAYPSGDYDARILAQCEHLGFSQGYAVIPTINTAPHLELPRIGLYTDSLDVLGFKVQWGNLIRRLKIKRG